VCYFLHPPVTASLSTMFSPLQPGLNTLNLCFSLSQYMTFILKQRLTNQLFGTAISVSASHDQIWYEHFYQKHNCVARFHYFQRPVFTFAYSHVMLLSASTSNSSHEQPKPFYEYRYMKGHVLSAPQSSVLHLYLTLQT
jgi:hypothetical protein